MEYLSQWYIKVAGRNVSEEIMDDIISIEVDNSLHLPDMFSIHLRDQLGGSGSYKWMDSNTLDLGKPVVISADPKGEEEKGELLSGEITAIEPEFIKDIGAAILVRGYDKSHRLHRGKKTASFLQQSDSQIVSKIAQTCGLQADVEATRPTHEHVIQDNQTDMEFIQERAWRNGYFVYADHNKLIFRSKPATSGPAPVLKWGENLHEFQARLTTADQVEKAEVHSWDTSQKKAILGTKASPSPIKPGISGETHGGNAARKAFGGQSVEVVIDHPVDTLEEANAIAQSVINEKCNAFLQAEGTCDGNPAVRAGATVKIEGIGKKFSGSYLITHAIHRYDSSGYTTWFEISGYHANTLGQLLSSNGNGKKGYGVVVGQVTNLNDPDNLGRVKVKYPGISDDLESHWARMVNPMAGPQRGFEFLPEVNDEVLVAFEYDDINHPYILGGLWNGKDKPPLTTNDAIKDGKVNKRIIKSRSGHTITLDDTDGKEKISIIDKTQKNLVEIDSKENTVAIKTDKNSMVIGTSKNTLTVNTDGDITIQAKGNVTLKGKDITLEATASAKVKAMSNLDLEASTKATIKGNAGVDVNASGPVNIKGAVINLN